MNYTLSADDIQDIVDATATAIVDTLTDKNIIVSTDGVINARVSIHLTDTILQYNIALQDRLTAKVEPYIADDVEDDRMGFRKYNPPAV